MSLHKFFGKLVMFALPLLVATAAGAAHRGVIPTPCHYEAAAGDYRITSGATIGYECEELRPVACYLADYMGVGVAGDAHGDITLRLDASLGREAYRLRVMTEGIVVEGGDYGGLFNGAVTLLQLLPPQVFSHALKLPASLACCVVEDAPRFAYRGFMLDVCRTWQPKEAVMAYIDLLAYHKINHLRLHLTDDEAWRIEIESHPELAEVGGFRGGDSPVWPRYGRWDERWGGYYTQEDMREIIDYARVRNITVVPEIDLPGHSLCIASVHPEIRCDYPLNTAAALGYDDRTAFCAAREENYVLLEDIIEEVCRLFDSPYIHIGGDEVDLSQWRKCPDCQALMRREGMTSEAELQSYFMSRIESFVAKYGRRAAVWNEAVEATPLSPDTRVYGWESVEACRKAAAKGYSTVVVPGQYFYLDMKQSPREPGHDWAAIFDASKVYNFSFSTLGFTAEELANVAGVEATFFSEVYASHNPESPDYLHYQTFPRLVAFADVAWRAGDDVAWDDFYPRLVAHYDRLDAMGVAYRLAPPSVEYGDGELSASVADDGSQLYYRCEPHDVEWLYHEPIATSSPARYTFVARRGRATSPVAAVAAHFRRLTPRFDISSSMASSERFSFDKAEGYGRLARTVRAADVGDWVQFTFAEGVVCRSLRVATGNFQLPRYIIERGYVEVSYDGVTFERVGELVCGGFTLHYPPHPVRAVRITSTSRGNGGRWVAIQPPTILPLLP